MSVTVNAVAQLIEKIAPKAWAEEWDNVGLLVGDGAAKVDKILLTLDGTPEVIEEAIEIGAQMILAHHPILFRPLKNLRVDNSAAQIPIKLIKHGIAYYAAHTNLDQSEFSSSWVLGKLLGLKEMELLAPVSDERLVKLAVYVPESDVEKVRLALVQTGVGENTTEGPHSAYYSEVFFQSAGEGIFKPLPGANPAIGTIGELARVSEVKLESILPERLVDRAVKALKKAHPYEEPAYDIIPLRNAGKTRGYGVIGTLPQIQDAVSFWVTLMELISINPSKQGQLFSRGYKLSGLRWAGEPKKLLRKVAIVNGSGGSFVPKALARGADILIAGDIDHHQVLDALQGDLVVADIGHFLSEAPMLTMLANYLRENKTLKAIEILLSQRNDVPWHE